MHATERSRNNTRLRFRTKSNLLASKNANTICEAAFVSKSVGWLLLLFCGSSVGHDAPQD